MIWIKNEEQFNVMKTVIHLQKRSEKGIIGNILKKKHYACI